MVALAGATGSGKSSTFNALAGRDVAVTGVRRPTTSSTQAALFTTGTTLGADAAGLLSWLDVRQHTVIDDPALDGLVLLESELHLDGLDVEFHRYPGTRHWFAEPDRPEHDPAAADLAWQRTLTFLGQHL